MTKFNKKYSPPIVSGADPTRQYAIFNVSPLLWQIKNHKDMVFSIYVW